MFFIKRYGSLFLVALLLFLVVQPALASEVEEQQLESVQGQMQEQQNTAAKARIKVTSVADQLKKIQDELDTVTAEYNTIQSNLVYTENQIETNEIILEKAEENLAERSRVLNHRMRDIYKNGQVGYLDVLLGASDFSDFSTRIDVLKRVISQDVALVNQVKAERQLVLQTRATLETDRASILGLKKSAIEKKMIVASRRQERQFVLDAAVSERDTAERAYQELLEMSKQIEQMIRRKQAGNRNQGPTGGTGALSWPLSGPITSPFGSRTHPIFGTTRYHSGIDIGADYGDAVAAADGGVVTEAGWMGGYGKAVIIDHGNGISTLYGHNSELLVSEGQRVGKGQTIARAGSTGYSTGPHVHFEVRQDGSPVDPMAYLP